jgi:glycosyltransferase involved in cell wall biosynthesis
VRAPSLRILQVVPSLVSETGGPSRSVPALGRALARIGHRVVLCTSNWANRGTAPHTSAPQCQDARYSVLTFPAQNSLLFPQLPHSPKLVRFVSDHWKDFDIIHIFSLWNPVATFVLRSLRRRRATYCLSPLGMLDPIVLRRNRWKKFPWRMLWERANIEGASLIHFTTGIEEEKAKASGFQMQRTIVVPHVVDLAAWSSLPGRAVLEERFPQVRGREVILFAGRIDWVKNLDRLLEATRLARRSRPRAMLVCAGPDNTGYRQTLERQAREIGMQEHLLFTGMLQEDELRAAYARADCFALVSKKENFGQTAAEALASGIPVVLSEGVGVGRNWPVGGPVLRVAPEPTEISQALIRMLERSASGVLPDPEARSLARNEFGQSSGVRLASAYFSLLYLQVV